MNRRSLTLAALITVSVVLAACADTTAPQARTSAPRVHAASPDILVGGSHT